VEWLLSHNIGCQCIDSWFAPAVLAQCQLIDDVLKVLLPVVTWDAASTVEQITGQFG
jgi:hypothetical protein